VDFVAATHPRFRREVCDQFLSRTDIKRTSRVKELSKGMITQLHLALVMAIDRSCWCWTSRRSASTS